MSRKVCFILITHFFALQVFAQHVAVVNGTNISSKEFMWVYKKNHMGTAHPSYQELADYLELYINFKLKVAEAKTLKLDTDSSYQTEINGYETALKNQKKISPKSAEYSFILNEYRDGVLMFNLSESTIWNKVQRDESALLDYYQSNKANYEGKAYDEVRGQVISDYQQLLENTWIKNLKTKHTVKINHDELKRLAKL